MKVRNKQRRTNTRTRASADRKLLTFCHRFQVIPKNTGEIVTKRHFDDIEPCICVFFYNRIRTVTHVFDPLYMHLTLFTIFIILWSQLPNKETDQLMIFIVL